jgi:hypothetical protein
MKRLEPITFWLIAFLHLIPVWGYRYIPTQDGPSHLNNAQIIKEYGNPEAGSNRVFEVHFDPLPNLSSHLLLAGMMFVVPPLIAEKLLISLYVLGFAGGFRYFLGAFGPSSRPLSWAGLLFVFNRCFWMGFYNYCLSLVLLWVILGYVLRRLGTFHAAHAFALMLLFTAAYFTHLLGYLLALAGAVLASILAPPRRLVTIGLILLAGLPSVCLALNYFEETRFSNSPAAMRVVNDPLDRLGGNLRETEIEKDLAAIDAEVLAFHAGPNTPLGMTFGGYLLVVTMLTIAIPPERSPGTPAGPGPVFPAVFGVLVLGAYLLMPDHLGGGDGGLPNGGFLKTRLAPLPALFWLACLREPRFWAVRLLLRLGIASLLGINLTMVTTAVRDGSRVLAQFTAGIDAVGRGHRVFAVQSAGWPSPYANPMFHALDYYCLGTGNVNVDNYEARMPHFPVKYRPEFNRGRGLWAGAGDKNGIDVLICWYADGGRPPGWEEVFHQEALRIYRRP